MKKIEVNPGYRTDHACITIELEINEQKKGEGFWKLNNSVLNDKEYVKKVKQVIENTKKYYALLPYNPEAINNIPEMDLCFSCDDSIFLEMLLMNI